MGQLPRLGKRELICLLLFTCNYVVFVWKSFLFLCVLGMDYVILLWHSLSLPYNYIDQKQRFQTFAMLENGVRYSEVASHLTVSQLTTTQLSIPLGDWVIFHYFTGLPWTFRIIISSPEPKAHR